MADRRTRPPSFERDPFGATSPNPVIADAQVFARSEPFRVPLMRPGATSFEFPGFGFDPETSSRPGAPIPGAGQGDKQPEKTPAGIRGVFAARSQQGGDGGTPGGAGPGSGGFSDVSVGAVNANNPSAEFGPVDVSLTDALSFAAPQPMGALMTAVQHGLFGPIGVIGPVAPAVGTQQFADTVAAADTQAAAAGAVSPDVSEGFNAPGVESLSETQQAQANAAAAASLNAMGLGVDAFGGPGAPAGTPGSADPGTVGATSSAAPGGGFGSSASESPSGGGGSPSGGNGPGGSSSGPSGSGGAPGGGSTGPGEGNGVSGPGGGEGGTAGGTGGGDPGKIVCTAMLNAYGFGGFRQRIWLEWARAKSPAYERGYHRIFLPFVRYAYRGDLTASKAAVRRVLEHIARRRTSDIWRSRHGRVDRIGRAWRIVLEPLCYAVGSVELALFGDRFKPDFSLDRRV